MELNPGLVVLAGFIVFLLGVLIKRFKWSPQGRAMLWLIFGISLAFGLAHVLIAAQTAPFPPFPGPAPAGFEALVFVWVPVLLAWVGEVVAWFVAGSLSIFAAAQMYYALIKKGIAPPALVAWMSGPPK